MYWNRGNTNFCAEKNVFFKYCRPRQIDNGVKFPLFDKRQPLGTFSIDTQRSFESTAKQLRYYRSPLESEFPLNLNLGVGTAIEKPKEWTERLDHLLQFICDRAEQLFSGNGELKRLKADFVNFRGLLRLIMCTPYERRSDWCIHVTRFRGTCYMLEIKTELHKKAEEKVTPYMKKCFSYGYKFEQFCMVDEPSAKPNINAPVDESSEFSGVFHVNLENMLLLFSGEIDGVLSDKPVTINSAKDMENLHFVELKTKLAFTKQGQIDNYQRYKTLNWWCQSFLVDIKDIFVGTRDEKGYVRSIERIAVESLPNQAKDWKPNVCANFLVNFLRRVSSLMRHIDCADTVYEFYYDPKIGQISYEEIKGKSEHSFLPDWYLKQFEQ